MKILFVNRMASMVRGGGETFDLEVARHLAGLGCEITFLTNIPLFGKAELNVGDGDRVKNVQLRSPYLPWFPWDKVKAGWRVRVWEFQQFEKKAAKWIESHGNEFDVIQICELPYLVSLLKANTSLQHLKVVMRLTAPNAYDPWCGTQKADKVIASGMTIAKMQAGPRPDCENVPNAVDLTRFKPPETERQHTVDGPSLLYVARFQDFKHHRMLVDAFSIFHKKFPTSVLRLVGSGHLEQKVREQVAQLKLGGSVEFLGEVHYEDLPGIYAEADLKVISSDYESFCFAAIEAMASKLPVVSTDCGWVPVLLGADRGKESIENLSAEICKAPGGLIAPVGEHEAFSEALVWLVEHPEEQKMMAVWNHEKAVREHGWDSSARKLLSIYESLVDGKE